MNKIKQLKECREKIDAGELPPESYANMLEAIRLMESGAMKKDELLRAASDKWRRMTRKEQQEKKNEYKKYIKTEIEKQKVNDDEKHIKQA